MAELQVAKRLTFRSELWGLSWEAWAGIYAGFIACLIALGGLVWMNSIAQQKQEEAYKKRQANSSTVKLDIEPAIFKKMDEIFRANGLCAKSCVDPAIWSPSSSRYIVSDGNILFLFTLSIATGVNSSDRSIDLIVSVVSQKQGVFDPAIQRSLSEILPMFGMPREAFERCLNNRPKVEVNEGNFYACSDQQRVEDRFKKERISAFLQWSRYIQLRKIGSFSEFRSKFYRDLEAK